MAKRTILITGASSGIGEALAIEWHRSYPEDQLVLAARSADVLQSIAAKIGAQVQILDLGEPKSIESAVQSLRSKNLLPDVMIHNAGLSQRSLAAETSIEVDRRLMEVNYFGTVYLTKLLLPSMLTRKAGHIVVVSSLVGKFGSPMRSGYSASKHALHGFFDSLRAELAAEHGDAAFPVTLICPGFIRTHLTFSALTRDGSPQNKMDVSTDQGMAPDVCGRKIIAAIERRKQEVNIGGKETLGVLVKRFAPRVFARLIKKARVT